MSKRTALALGLACVGLLAFCVFSIGLACTKGSERDCRNALVGFAIGYYFGSRP